MRAVIAALALKKIKIYIHIYTVISLLRPPFLLNYMLLPKREGLLEGGGGLIRRGKLKRGRERGGLNREITVTLMQRSIKLRTLLGWWTDPSLIIPSTIVMCSINNRWSN